MHGSGAQMTEVDPINLYNVDQAFDQAVQVDLKKLGNGHQTLGDYIASKSLQASPRGTDGLSVGIKHDQEKPRFGLVPPKALEEVAKVLTYGARKYSAENWRHVEVSRYFDAAQRHQWSYKQGQTIDPESGYNHLAHAICSLMFMLEQDLESKATP